jgi:hypothetical protein
MHIRGRLRRIGILAAVVTATSGCDAGSVSQNGGTDAASDVVDASLPADEPDASADTPDAAPPPPDAEPAPDAEPPAPTQSVSVTTFNMARVTADGDRREISMDTTFPPHGPWKKVTMHLDLKCPPGACDPWDRWGAISLLADLGNGQKQLEIARFVTPYQREAGWDFDVTELQTLLAGPRTMRAFIDTWGGQGFVVTVRFDFEAGQPARRPVKVIPIEWSNEPNTRRYVPFGYDSNPVANQLKPKSITLPSSGFSQAGTFVITTGHGQANTQNCAEFCPKKHRVLVDGGVHEKVIWRDNCELNPVQPQSGTWQYDRAGWCPGSNVLPWLEDLGTSFAPGSTHTIGYDVEAYTNKCWSHDGNDGICTDCPFGAGSCKYDEGSHTEPYYLVTAYLILFK